jgi:glycosyltransferase involved in cell wall biosynthesis
MLISLITITYNSEKYLRDTIESVLRQDYPDIEYIVVDGASKDATLDIVKSYEPQFNGRMKWISEPDKGLYDALNKGIRMATGEVVGILNSDDFFTSNSVLSKLATTFKNTHCDAIYGDIHFVNPNYLDKCVRYYSSATFRRSFMKIGIMPAHPSFYIYKKFFDKLGYYKTDYKIAADFELLLRFLYIHQINAQYIYLDVVTMRMGGMSTKSIKNRIIIMNEQLKAFRENGIYNNALILSLRYPMKTIDILKPKVRCFINRIKK